LVDFLEIAAYVFTADCATNRGEEWQEESVESWDRDFSFVIPVRDLEFWCNSAIANQLQQLLCFMSDDKYTFTFVPLKSDSRGLQEYIEFGENQNWPFKKPARVVMFSGGLDSLAGAVESAIEDKPLLLVSHRSATTLDARQQKLFGELEHMFPGKLVHVPVWVNKNEGLRRESTQRTRSFLFTALGTVAAELVEADGVRFYENGVVSLNFPVAGEALRTRASRTTHPVTLHLLQELCSKVLDRPFAIDNPYLFKSKTDVVQTLVSNNAAHLIANTCSCAHLIFSQKAQRHCGSCSQCIDRRFAIVAAGLEKYDAETDYASDVFFGPRKEGYEQNMAIDYTRHALELEQRTESDLVEIFNAELSRAVRFQERRSKAAEQLIDLHKRHGRAITRVLKKMIQDHAELLAKGAINKDCLLALVLGTNLGISSPGKLGDRPPLDSHRDSLAVMEGKLDLLLNKFGHLNKRPHKPKRKKLTKHDTVIFAAIKMGHEGLGYCSFLQNCGVVPRWTEGPASYGKAYKEGNPWRKKIQDEKTRARVRMSEYSQSEIAEALNKYLPAEFEQISALINSRNSQLASKTSIASTRTNTEPSAN